MVNDTDTNGHVDNLVAYVAPGEVILPWTEDPADPMYTVCNDAFEKLTEEKDAKGRTIKVHKVCDFCLSTLAASCCVSLYLSLSSFPIYIYMY